MADAFNMLYRLFAPLFVVILIIAGVDLSSGLIKNSQEKQTAISVTYASSCPVGSVPSPSCMPAGPPSKGGKDGLPCNVAVPKAGTIAATCLAGCCKAGGWPGADGKPATPSSSSNPLSSALSGKAVSGMLQSLMQKLMGGGGGGDTPAQQDLSNPPICKSLTVTPSIPLAPGESATLTWTLEGGRPEAVVVSPGVGLVQGLSVKVAPSVSTTYTVAARNGDGTSTCPQVRVYVGPRNVGDEDTFSTDNTNPQYNTDVDIWGDTTNTEPIVSGDSAYDNVSDITITNNSENTNDNYYDFLTSLAADIQESPDTTEGTYYYGDEVDNWELLEYDPVTDISSVVIPDPQIDTGFSGDVYIDDYYTDYYTDNSNEGNGLTDEEIYGIWNRPQNPSTGGLGLSGGLSSSANNVPAVDLSPDEEVGILGKVLGWVKNTFCVWCSDTSGQVSGDAQLAAISSSFNINPTEDKNKVLGQPSVALKPLVQDSLFVKMKSLRCTDMATGKVSNDEININIITIGSGNSKIRASDGFTETEEFEISSEKKEGVVLGAKSCRIYSPGEYTITALFQSKGDKGASQELSSNITCNEPLLSIMDARYAGGATDMLDGAKHLFLPGKVTLKNTLDATITPLTSFVVFCGDIKKGINQERIDKIGELGDRGGSTVPTNCKTVFGSVGTMDTRGTCTPVAQQDTKNQEGKQITAAEKCVQDGGTVVGKNPEGRVMCRKGTPPGATTQQKQQQDMAARQQQQAQQDALKRAQQQAQQKAAAQKAAAQKAAAQQRPPVQQPPQQPSPQDQSWLQQLLAKLKGEQQPECVSLTANKTKIRKGEEITLKWIVSGASKIVVTPKVELVTGEGKRYAKASPESSVKYTLIATNDKGQEHRCQSQQIIVVEDTEQALACKGKVGTVAMTIEPSEITRSACAAGQTEQECDDTWEGKETAIKWDLSCMAQCTLTGPDGLEKDDIDTSKDSDELVGMLRKTSTFKMTCEDWEGEQAEDEVTATVTQE